jgi:hypothetical protein
VNIYIYCRDNLVFVLKGTLIYSQEKDQTF